MIALLSRIFIKNKDDASPETRRAYGVLCSVVGIFLNLLLFAGKYAAGVLSGSIAVTADAFNNLSDAGSSVVTLLGFRMAAVKPDYEHPFGHGRIEYLSGVAVSIVIVVVGAQLMRDSVAKIMNPQPIDASWLAVGILVASILVKFYMFRYNSAIGKKLASPGMSATARDSLSDCAATFVVLLCTLIARYSGESVDGLGGAAVALFIIWTGFKSVKETISPLLGNPPEPELVRQIEEIVMSHGDIVNMHDLIVHDYGPGRLIISLHAEVPGDGDLCALHDTVDTIESELSERLGCLAVIHMDPISYDDSKVNRMRAQLTEAVEAIEPRITIHDFRIVDGPTHTNVIFDAVVPNDLQWKDDEIKAELEKAVRGLWESSNPKVNIDRPYM